MCDGSNPPVLGGHSWEHGWFTNSAAHVSRPVVQTLDVQTHVPKWATEHHRNIANLPPHRNKMSDGVSYGGTEGKRGSLLLLVLPLSIAIICGLDLFCSLLLS